jgi:hypothetical protein
VIIRLAHAPSRTAGRWASFGRLIDGAPASGRPLRERGVVDASKAAARTLVAVHLTPI